MKRINHFPLYPPLQVGGGGSDAHGSFVQTAFKRELISATHTWKQSSEPVQFFLQILIKSYK